MRPLLWAVPLVLILFLWTVNQFLRGRRKELLSGILVLLIFGLCIVAFSVSGWQYGLGALIGSFILPSLLRPPAFLVAKRLIDYPDLGAEDYARARQKKFEKMLGDFGSPAFFEEMEKECREQEAHMKLTVRKAMSRADIQAVLKRHSGSHQDVKAFYQRVEITSLPPHLREKAVCNANMLDYFLSNSVRAEAAGEYSRNVQTQDAHITLSAWAARNPAGTSPR